jgi:hypothetical protein
MILNRDTILQANDLPMEAVEVPEWGGTVHIKTMSGTERDRFDAAIIKRGKSDDTFDTRGLRVDVVVLTACDENGNLLFTDDDKPALSKKSGAVLDRLCNVARKLNGILDTDSDAVKESKKN